MIKFVKKANQWCVTYFTKGEKGPIQHQKWFGKDEKEKAEDFELTTKSE